MKDNPSIEPASWPEIATINERVCSGVRAYQRRLQFLTGAAFLCGFLAVAASVAIASAYFVLYRPKQMTLLRDVTEAAREARAQQQALPGEKPSHRELDFPSVQATMVHVLSFGTMMVAVSVGLLGMGTMVMLLVVVLSRRATLHQINASLSQISVQLKALQPLKAGS